jgi:hypothetical protein
VLLVIVVPTSPPSPPITTVLGNVAALAAGEFHTCALTANGQPFCWGKNLFGQIGDGTTTNRLTATKVPSFQFNIDAEVDLAGHARVAIVTALAACPEGQSVQIRVSLTQGGTVGDGVAEGACTEALGRYPVMVPAKGRASWVPGSALAEADAIVRARGTVVETQEWTREVTLDFSP